MLTTQEIKTFIESDSASTKKQLAKVGVRYYESDHDIKDYRIFFVNAEGKIEEDKLKSNIKISHPFFKIIVDQQVQYMLSGKTEYIKSDIPELQAEMNNYFNYNDEFNAELYELLTGTVVKGFENMYAYKNTDGITAFMCADSLGVVEVKEKETDDGCEYVIYWYVDRIGKDNKKITRIQVWDDKQTTFFCQEEHGQIVLDESVKINPRPHILYTKNGSKDTYFDGFGFIPFFRLDNNKKQISGLKPIKPLIDDYDLMSCGLSNNIQDSNEVLYVVKGFQGDNMDLLHLNVRSKKLVGVDEDGGIDIKTIDIPYQARQAKLELDEKNIFRFGMGLNTESLKDTSATTSIAIKSAYANLDLKCESLTKELKKFMRKLVKVVLDEINALHGTDYRQKDVYFDFQRETITNAHENAQIELTDAQKQQVQITTLLDLATYLGNELLMQNICDVLDLDYEELKDKFPKQDDDLATVQNTLNNLPAEDDPVVVKSFSA